jgi:hypothetical protein
MLLVIKELLFSKQKALTHHHDWFMKDADFYGVRRQSKGNRGGVAAPHISSCRRAATSLQQEELGKLASAYSKFSH